VHLKKRAKGFSACRAEHSSVAVPHNNKRRIGRESHLCILLCGAKSGNVGRTNSVKKLFESPLHEPFFIDRKNAPIAHRKMLSARSEM